MRITPYIPTNFWIPLAALKKRRELERKGFPTNLYNWRFVTLTIDRDLFPDPEDAYESGRDFLRKFIFELRKEFSIQRWCWKLELHQADGFGRRYPHWHLLLEYKRPIPAERLNKVWAMGRTEIKGVRDNGFSYMFKYMLKAQETVPEWIGERKQVRLFQTSKGFFPPSGDEQKNRQEASPRPAEDDRLSDTENERVGVSNTIGERLEKWSKLVVGRVVLPDGSFRHRLYRIAVGWEDFLVRMCQLRFAHGLRDDVLKVARFSIESEISWITQNWLPGCTS